MSTPRKPDLDQLITALTADGRPDELTGRDAARTAFRAARQRDAADRTTVLRRRGAFRRPLTAAPRRLTAIAAAGIIVTAGVSAAAYTQALPAPVQQIAHTVFAPLGVPNSQQQSGRTAPGTGASAVIAATSGGTAKTSTPRPGDDYLITVAASRKRVPANGEVAFTGRVTERGRTAARVLVRLFERLAGSTQFKLVATGVTGPLGGFRLSSPPLTATAVFRVVGPDAAHSAAVRVAVAPGKVTAGVADDAPGPVPTGQ